MDRVDDVSIIQMIPRLLGKQLAVTWIVDLFELALVGAACALTCSLAGPGRLSSIATRHLAREAVEVLVGWLILLLDGGKCCGTVEVCGMGGSRNNVVDRREECKVEAGYK
jgi:hypothetical protein